MRETEQEQDLFEAKQYQTVIPTHDIHSRKREGGKKSTLHNTLSELFSDGLGDTQS